MKLLTIGTYTVEALGAIFTNSFSLQDLKILYYSDNNDDNVDNNDSVEDINNFDINDKVEKIGSVDNVDNVHTVDHHITVNS